MYVPKNRDILRFWEKGDPLLFFDNVVLESSFYPRRLAARHRRLPWFRLSCRRKMLDTGKSRIRELILGWVLKCFEDGRWY